MKLTYKYRIEPNQAQKIFLNDHFGCVRFLYNKLLNDALFSEVFGKKMHGTKFRHKSTFRKLQILKNELEWLNNVNQEILLNILFEFENTIKKYNRNFHRGKDCELHFRKKVDNKGSFVIFSDFHVNLETNRLIIPGFKEGIKIKFHRNFDNPVQNLTIIKNNIDQYYACFSIEQEIKEKPKVRKKETIGIDLGLSSLIITSNGDKIENKRYFKNDISKINFIKRKLKKYGGKKNLKLYRKAHKKIVNKRKDHLNKVSSKLISENQTIAIKDLNIIEMLKDKRLRGAILDASWGNLVLMLEYKANLNGVNLLKIGRFQASTKYVPIAAKL